MHLRMLSPEAPLGWRAEVCADQVYQPILHLVLQGSKALSIGDKLQKYEAATYFIVPVNVPATGQIRKGGPGWPYFAINRTLDPEIIASLLQGEVDDSVPAQAPCFSGVSASDEKWSTRGYA